MSNEDDIRDIEHKYAVITYEARKQMSHAEQLAYGLAWTQASEYFNEIVNLHNSQMVAQMSDAEFKHYLEKRLEQ